MISEEFPLSPIPCFWCSFVHSCTFCPTHLAPWTLLLFSLLFILLQPHQLHCRSSTRTGPVCFCTGCLPRVVLDSHLVPSGILYFTYLFDYWLSLLLECKLHAGGVCACALFSDWSASFNAVFLAHEQCLVFNWYSINIWKKYLFHFWTRYHIWEKRSNCK